MKSDRLSSQIHEETWVTGSGWGSCPAPVDSATKTIGPTSQMCTVTAAYLLQYLIA